MDEKQCEKIGLKRPETERKCNEEECPEWYEGSWSAVCFFFVLLKTFLK